jgi:hypothetical protein
VGDALCNFGGNLGIVLNLLMVKCLVGTHTSWTPKASSYSAFMEDPFHCFGEKSEGLRQDQSFDQRKEPLQL